MQTGLGELPTKHQVLNHCLFLPWKEPEAQEEQVEGAEDTRGRRHFGCIQQVLHKYPSPSPGKAEKVDWE